jgi:hypothetical protein
LFKYDEETVKEVDLDDEDNDDVDDELTKEINGKMKDTKVIESSDDEVEDSEDELEEKKPEVIVKAKATRGKK